MTMTMKQPYSTKKDVDNSYQLNTPKLKNASSPPVSPPNTKTPTTKTKSVSSKKKKNAKPRSKRHSSTKSQPKKPMSSTTTSIGPTVQNLRRRIFVPEMGHQKSGRTSRRRRRRCRRFCPGKTSRTRRRVRFARRTLRLSRRRSRKFRLKAVEDDHLRNVKVQE